MIQNSQKLSELNENWKAIEEGSEDAWNNRHNNPVEIELKKLGEIISQNLNDTTPEGKAKHDAALKKYKELAARGKLEEGLEDVIDTPEKEAGEIEAAVKEEPKEVEVVAVAVSDEKTEEAPKKSSNRNTPTSTKFSIKDDNSAPTVDVKRDEGVKSSGIKEYNATGKVVPETTSPVAREMGVKSGRKEVEKTDHGTKKEVDLANFVGREEGVKSAPKVYLEGYKATISSSLNKIKESFSI